MNVSARQTFFSGVRDELPLLVGVVPFGMIYGILALGAGLNPFDAQAMSAVIFAGSSQFAAVQLLKVGTPALVVIVTAFVINLRHALYSASLAPYVRKLNPLWKTLLSYLLTDEAYAVTITRFQGQGETPLGHWYFFGAGLALWSCWQLSTAAGIFLGAQVPAAWGLDLTLSLTFIALVVPALKDRAAIAAAAIASVAALLSIGLPFRLGLMVAAVAGIAAGMWVETRG